MQCVEQEWIGFVVKSPVQSIGLKPDVQRQAHLEKRARNKPLRVKRVIVRDCAVVGEDEWIHDRNAALRAKQHRFFRQQWI